MTLNAESHFLSQLKALASDIISEADLDRYLQVSQKRKKPLRVKFGIDPTFTDVHVGHCVPIRVLRLFQEAGHLPVLILGDATARLGDPTGRNDQRPALSAEEVEHNATSYFTQIGKVLDLSEGACEIHRNSEWFSGMDFFEVLRLLSESTVARLLERDDFQKRMEKKLPVHLHEMAYPLMQGWDSVQVRADVELGGNDQLFNLHMGRQLQERHGQQPQVCLTTPLLLGTDGRKMSKTYANHIPLTASAKDVFGKVMSLEDDAMESWFRLATSVSSEEVRALLEGHPREAKGRLAQEVCAWVHDEPSAQAAADNFVQQFREKQLPTEIATFTLEAKDWPLPTLLKELGLCASTSEARRMIEGGGVRVSQNVCTDVRFLLTLEIGKEVVLVQAGKRKFAYVQGT